MIDRRQEIAVATLRRFLFLVHPDLISAGPARKVNAANVGVLQAYVREHHYQGSAWLLFHKKKAAAAKEEPLESVRVVVGRGVEACVASMAAALGEPTAEARGGAGAQRWWTPPRPPERPKPSDCDAVDAAARRQSLARAAAKARRIARSRGLRHIESRCGWEPSRLSQVLTSLEAALGETHLDGLWDVVIASLQQAEADVDDGVVTISPSASAAAWRQAFSEASSWREVRLARQKNLEEAWRDAEAGLASALGRPVSLVRGLTLDANRFARWCRRFAGGVPTSAARPMLRLRVELDASASNYLQTADLALSEADDLAAIVSKAARVEDDLVCRAERMRSDVRALAVDCVRALGLNSIDIVLAQCPAIVRTHPERDDLFVLAGAHLPRGAAMSDVLDLFDRLLAAQGDPRLDLLRRASVAVVAPGSPRGYDNAGFYRLPADFLRHPR